MARKALVGLLFLGLPAQAEESSTVEALWSLFSDHCGRYIAAETPAEAIAAFKPHQLRQVVSTDGRLIDGGVSIEDPGIEPLKFVTFTTAESRLNGGRLRTCFLVTTDPPGVDVLKLPDYAQKHASELIGEDFYVVGGAAVARYGVGGLSIGLHTPGFPPLKSIRVSVNVRHVTMIVQVAIPETD